MTMPPPVMPPAVPPYGATQPVRSDRVNVLAVLAVCLWPFTLLGAIASIVTGHIALSQISRTSERGRPIAITGLVLGYVSAAANLIGGIILVVVLTTAAIAGMSSVASAGSRADTSGDDLSATATGLAVGDCFDDDDFSDTSGEVRTADCAATHDDETYAVLTVPGSGAYPGDDNLSETVDDLCEPLFEDYVGSGYDDTSLDYDMIYPTEDTWAAGDRSVMCFVYDDNGEVTDSLKGRGAEFPPTEDASKA